MQKENDEKIKKLNEELEKAKQDLTNPQNKEGPLTRDEIGKLIAEAFEKNKEAVEAKAKKMGIGPEDIVNLPNGVSVIKSKDPSKPPMFIMPQEPLRRAIQAYTDSESDSLKSSKLSVSTEKSALPDPMQQMMLGMLMGKNMELMMQDDSSSTSSKSSKSSKSSLSRTPIIINQPPPNYYQPPPQEMLPQLRSGKSLRASETNFNSSQQLPKIKKVDATSKYKAQISSSSTVSLKSASALGDPIPPPVKLPFVYGSAIQELPMPKPAPSLMIEKPSSLRNLDIPIQNHSYVRAPAKNQLSLPPLMPMMPMYFPQYQPPPQQQPPTPQRPKTPEAPSPKEPVTEPTDTYAKASYKIWKVYTLLKFMTIKADLNKVLLKTKYDFSNSYFTEDLPAIKEQCFLMIKTRMEPLITDIVENPSLANLSNNTSELNSTVGLVMDEMLDLVTIKQNQKFDNPFVLSFLANTIFNGCFVPNEYYTLFEFCRLPFHSTGQLGDTTEELQAMLASSLLLVRTLCRELLFQVKVHFPALKYQPRSEQNVKMVGAIIYDGFMEALAAPVQQIPDNTEVITLNDIPRPMDEGLGYLPVYDGPPNKLELLMKAPVPIIHDQDSVLRKMKEFGRRIVLFARMQVEDEKLPLHKRKIDGYRESARKVGKINRDLADQLNEYAADKERDLKLV